MRAPKRLLFVDDPRFERHVCEHPHPEAPDRLKAIREGLVVPLRDAGALRIEPRPATSAELLPVHSETYLDTLRAALAQGTAGYLDPDTFFSPGSADAAFLAAGSAAELGAQLARSHNTAAVLAARPPGHHATRTRAMGFCLINNVAVAAAAALASGLQRVAILDWDVHHGNGTQAIFEADSRVLYLSLHQWPLYPGTGRSEEIGREKGLGYTVNLPLPQGSDGADYRAALAQVVFPILHQFRPELVLISAGFDAHVADPLGGMNLRDHDFGALTTAIIKESSAVGCERLGFVLEGGYDLSALEHSGHAMAEALLGAERQLDADTPKARAQQAIDRTRFALARHWKL